MSEPGFAAGLFPDRDSAEGPFLRFPCLIHFRPGGAASAGPVSGAEREERGRTTMDPHRRMNRILFVDDDRYFLDGLNRTLRSERHAWEIVCAESAAEAMNRTDRIPFDAIVTDINMPGMNGLDLLRALRDREATRDTPVVILTGRAERDLKRRALDLGATDLLNKPIEREDLIARLRSVIRLKEAQDELKERNRLLDEKVRERTRELEESRLEIILRLAKAAEFRDRETGNHVIRVGCYSRILAEELGEDRDFAEAIFLAAPLHDIGKIGIPDAILNKPGPLTAREAIVMRRHSSIGADLLLRDPLAFDRISGQHDANRFRRADRSGIPILRIAAAVTRSHHERWDGTGYPDGLRGESIPLSARIVALADSWDAIRSVRPYKPARSEEETIAILRAETEAQFDPRVVEATLSAVGRFRDVEARFNDSVEKAATESA
ncbi:MAG: response regulator [Candidatus Eisenbacteria bacterium]|nr:response regulator [Candidatus Eisenbacteria bacterium]